jgi:hypothetical protein
MPQLSGWLWFLIDVVLVAALAAAMIYGIVRWRRRRRSPVIDHARDEATQRVYRNEEGKRRALGQE